MSGSKEWVLKKESELRCEVQESQVLTLKMTAGSSEIFGVELAPNKEYTFRDQNIAIYTWYGCTIETSTDSGIYIDDSTPMISYVNTHIQLQARRDVALNNNDNGPRVSKIVFDFF
jgi:polyribonucleotide 5'-hydroxyl-kinase